MKCRYSEDDIALYVEGDLGQSSLCEIEAHLLSCEVCRALAIELRESQAAFKSIRQDVVSGAALASLRSGVIAELGARRKRVTWWRWAYAVAGVACAAIVFVGLTWHSLKPSPHPQGQAGAPQVGHVSVESTPKIETIPGTVTNTPSTQTAKHLPRKPRAVREAQARQSAASRMRSDREIGPEPPKQLVVKLLTDDPNIVIYWLVDENGGSL